MALRFLYLLFIALLSCSQPQHILVCTKTNAFRHASIPEGIEALKKLASKDLKFDFTEDSLDFNSDNLIQYDAVIFLNTSGDILNSNQQQALKSFLKKGNGFLGVHAASDTEHDWEWYGNLIGARFKSHPPICIAAINVDKSISHPCCAHLDKTWTRKDEWYQFEEVPVPYANILLKLDTTSNLDTLGSRPYPLAWSHIYDGVPVFYTAIGHRKEAYYEKEFIEHLKGSIHWILSNGQD